MKSEPQHEQINKCVGKIFSGQGQETC